MQKHHTVKRNLGQLFFNPFGLHDKKIIDGEKHLSYYSSASLLMNLFFHSSVLSTISKSLPASSTSSHQVEPSRSTEVNLRSAEVKEEEVDVEADPEEDENSPQEFIAAEDEEEISRQKTEGEMNGGQVLSPSDMLSR